MWPRILHILLFLKETHRMEHVVIEYFVDPEKYIYLILLYVFAAVYVGVITILGVGTTLFIYCRHLCGMFQIASYRIKQAINTDIQRNVSQMKHQFHGLVFAVHIHRKAIEYTETLTSNFESSFFVLIIILVICLSLNMYRVFQIIYFENDIMRLSLHVTYIMSIIVFILLSNYTMQDITNHNNYVFLTVYKVHWYITPLRIQRLILLLIQRGNKPLIPKLGGIFTASLQNFAAMMSMSMSYFTVLYSTQTRYKKTSD
ncbi:odorant receptor 4-like [Harpegnathos saltator]|uniref:odorant receptor 4-like n=1 Tax=Harpegnathos saltator TaxID=610380 RepID=UPI000DBEEBFF|nr:odorant receptor 4-like [Harpegnathos saltator]